MEEIGKKIKKVREDKSMTQEEFAELLGMSRPTFIAIEKGTRELRLSEYQKIRQLFNIEDLDEDNPVRDDRKFIQMFFYFLSKYPEGIPKTKLAKLLYLADFSKYYFETEPISGVQYIRRTYGPVADIFFETIDDLFEQGKIDIIIADQAFLLRDISLSSNDNLLSENDKQWMDKVDKYWHNRKTAEIVNFTHEQNPWCLSRDNEKIPYFTIIQEEPDHVYAPRPL